jgi:SAM-dependent methyltransferase
MTHDFEFDSDYWQRHWSDRPGTGQVRAHPHLERELSGLPAGTALEAGCGEGAEAIWLAEHGWQVTAVDISGEALGRAADHAAGSAAAARITWVEADLSTWEPDQRFDLVTSHYAHASIPQLDLYDRLAHWVAPGGSLLLVGHLDTGGSDPHHHDGHPPGHATVTAAAVSARLDPDVWRVVTTDEGPRTVSDRAGVSVTLHDVVVRASRR